MRGLGWRRGALLVACAAGPAAAAVEYDTAPGSSLAGPSRPRVLLRPWAVERLLGGCAPTGTHLALLRPELAEHFTHQVLVMSKDNLGAQCGP